MAKKPIRHRIEYTRNKHSRAVYRENTIVIRLAKNLSKTEEQEHIRSLLRRMTQLVLMEQEKILINPFDHLLSGGQSQTVLLATGKRVRFQLEAGTATRAHKTTYGWRITIGPNTRRKALHTLLWKKLSEQELPRIDALVRSINEQTYDARVREVKIRFATTQWGSCSQRGVIMLNSALLFVPPSLLRYVIIHELAHRRVPNHSNSFWREVEWAMPHYEKVIRKLKEYRLPNL